jgi:DNA polymerase-3 subunit epsilon
VAFRKTLPTFYYLDHFSEFLAFFDGDNAALLTEEAAEFIARFRQSDPMLQAMIVRIANRKHPVIARKTLDYEELEQTDTLLDTLYQWQWITQLDCAPVELLSQTLPKAELFSSDGQTFTASFYQQSGATTVFY